MFGRRLSGFRGILRYGAHDDGLCGSRGFLGGDPRKRELAAEALAATAIDVGNYAAVRIRLEGKDYADGRLYRKEGDWFVDGG